MTRKNKSRRPTLAQQHAIFLDKMAQAFRRCESCGIRHGTMIEQPSGAYFRYELALHHIFGRPWDFRRRNLAVWCQVCRGQSDRPRHPVPVQKAVPTQSNPLRAEEAKQNA